MELQGRLLISSGGLFDPNFRHTVVLIVEHDVDGALGLVLNRPARLTVSDAVPELAAILDPDDNLYIGGPVQPQAAVILAEYEPDTSEHHSVIGNIGLVGELDMDATGAIRRARVFGGYSGWAPGQLEDEIARDDWIIEDAEPEDVFTEDPAHLWHEVLRRKGDAFEMLARMPFDPSQN
jgi:putative transcriptional regulator